MKEGRRIMVPTVQFYLYETLPGKLIYGDREQISGGKGRTWWEGLTGKLLQGKL